MNPEDQRRNSAAGADASLYYTRRSYLRDRAKPKQGRFTWTFAWLESRSRGQRASFLPAQKEQKKGPRTGEAPGT